LQNFFFLAAGLAVLVVALFACYALYRLGRMLASLEETLTTTDEALREVVPEVRDGLDNVNDITEGVNIALRTTGVGALRLTEAAARSSQRASATLHGVRVAAGSLWRSFVSIEEAQGERPDGK
jgi:UDP-N-acetylenolpyruvoylglucosamine reductase